MAGKLDSNSAFGPNMLKSLLCVTPVAIMALLNSAPPEPKYDSNVTAHSIVIAVNMFDGIEMLQVLLEKDGNCKLPDGLQIAIIVIVCIYLFVSFLELAKIKFKDYEEPKMRKRIFYIYFCFQGVLNLSFLIVRIVLWAKYERDAAIFIAKNLISLGHLGLEFYLVHWGQDNAD